MPAPVNGITGATGDRSPASADIVAEARQRQADRLRASQAENTKPTEVVERGEKSEETTTAPRREPIPPPYRVNLDDAGRLTTEVLDTETGEIIMRIPPTYVDPAEHAEAAAEVKSEGKPSGSPSREVKA